LSSRWALVVHRSAGCPQIVGGPPIRGLTRVDWKRAVAPWVGRGSVSVVLAFRFLGWHDLGLARRLFPDTLLCERSWLFVKAGKSQGNVKVCDLGVKFGRVSSTFNTGYEWWPASWDDEGSYTDHRQNEGHRCQCRMPLIPEWVPPRARIRPRMICPGMWGGPGSGRWLTCSAACLIPEIPEGFGTRWARCWR